MLFTTVDTPKKFKNTKGSKYHAFVAAVRDLAPGKSLCVSVAALKAEFPTCRDPLGAIYTACTNAELSVSIQQDRVEGKAFITPLK